MTTPSHPPRARPAAAGLAVVLALSLVGLAVVAVHDLAVDQDWATGELWTARLVDDVDGLTATDGLVAGAVAALMVGLALVVLALKPGRRTHLATSADGDVWFSPRAVAALARSVADRSPGVISAEATRVTRRQVVVEIVTQQDRETVVAGVRAALDGSVAGLTAATVTARATELPS